MVGFMAGSSVTVTVCVPVVVSPDEFVAVYVMIVVPVGNTKLSHCLFGSCGVGHEKVGTPVRVIFTVPQSSSAVATPNSSSRVAVQLLVVAVTFGGTCRVGGVVSVPVTVTVCVQDAD